MELDGPIVLAIVYAVLALLKKVGERAKGRATESLGQGEARPRSRSRRPAPKTMEELLREMRGELEAPEPVVVAKAPRRLPAPVEPSWEWEVEERETLETDPTVVSTEVAEAFDRPVPVRVDYDEAAEALVERRVKAAALRDGALRPEDHRRFDAKIRAEAPVPVARPSRAAEVRRAMIWHEVLAKPVSLRDPE